MMWSSIRGEMAEGLVSCTRGRGVRYHNGVWYKATSHSSLCIGDKIGRHCMFPQVLQNGWTSAGVVGISGK